MIHYVKSFLALLFGLLSNDILLAQQLQQDSVSYADTAKIREEKADPILENPIPWSIFVEASAEYAPQPDEHNFHHQFAVGASYRMINIAEFCKLSLKLSGDFTLSQHSRVQYFQNRLFLFFSDIWLCYWNQRSTP